MKLSTSFNPLLSRLSLAAVLSLTALYAQAQTAPTWARVQRHGSTSGDSNGRSIAVAADGSQYVAGTFNGSITLGTVTLTASAGDNHIFLAKYNAAGVVQWATKLDAADEELYTRVAVDAAGNAYLAGYFGTTLKVGTTTLTSPGTDAYLVKFNAQGVLQWAKQGGSEDVYVQGVSVDGSGNVTIAGDFSTTVGFGGASSLSGGGVFVYRFSPTGAVLMSKRVSDAGITNASTMDAAGNTYIVGGYEDSFTAYTASPTTLNSVGSTDMFLVKVDAAGTVLWARSDGSNVEESAQGVAVDANGNPLVVGYFGGVASSTSESSQIYVARYTNQGTQVWSRKIAPSSPSFIYATDAAYDGRGGYYVTGILQSTATFGTTTLTAVGDNMFVVRYDSQGNAVWADRAAGTNPATDASLGWGIAADASGNAYVTGPIIGNVTFGTLPTSGSGIGTFVAKLNAGGTIASAKSATAALKLSLYPNPATGSTTLLLPAGGGRLVLSDALGRTVREQALPTVAGACPVSLEGLTPGVYQLRATLGTGEVATAALTVR